MARYEFRFRRTIKQYSYRQRFKGLKSNEQTKLRKYKQVLLALLTKKKMGEQSGSPIDDKLARILKAVSACYLSIVHDSGETAETRPSWGRTLDSFSASDCWIYFRFCKVEMRELITLLHLPRECQFDNRTKMSGEEIILRGLYELVSGGNQETTCSTVFGGEQSLQSRASNYFITHVYDTFQHLVHDNLGWWHRNGFFETSANAIGNKLGIVGNLVAVFIDCNCLPTSVVGGGPTDDGANSLRWSDVIQRAFYNGWKSIHGLKHQSINDAFGFTWDLFGPTALRRNDNKLYRDSDINDRFAAVQILSLLQFIIFGDTAYHKKSHTTSYHKACDMIENFKDWNRRMKSVRISIEWDYGYTATLFRYICNKQKLKLLRGKSTSKVYTVCTILRNIHTGYYGCQTSNYFNLVVPDNFVYAYLTQTDL